MRCDHLNTLLGEAFIQRITVMGAVTDQSFREFIDESRIQGGVDKGDFVG